MANIPISSDLKIDNKNFSVDLHHNFSNLALSLSSKQNGSFSALTLPAGITIFPEEDGGEQGLFVYVDVGTLPNTASTMTFPHGLTIARSVRIFGTADDTTAKINLPLPFVSSVGADVIGLYLDSTNINIIVGKDRSSYTARIGILFTE